MKNTKTSPYFLLILFLGLISIPVSSIANSNEAYAPIQKYMEGFKNGNFVIGTTTADGVKSIVGPYITETENSITYKRSFTGYSFSAEWTLTEGKLSYFSINTFYDESQYGSVSNDAQEIKNLLTSIFGTPVVSELSYSDWEYGELLISLDSFEDGYSIYVDPLEGSNSLDDYLCVGDFYNLKLDLKDVFINNIKSGAIKIGKTTKAQMNTITGAEELYDKDYDGLWVAGTFSYDEKGYLSSLSLDFFYDCSGALVLLDTDKVEITDIVNEVIGTDGSTDSEGVNATVRWNVGGQSLRQEGYDDGYAILLDKY